MGASALNHRCNTSFLRGSAGSKLMPLLAPPIGGPATLNFISIVLANESTSFISRPFRIRVPPPDRKSTRLNSSHVRISYAVFCLKKKKKKKKKKNEKK